jgi:hypothetical protein
MDTTTCALCNRPAPRRTCLDCELRITRDLHDIARLANAGRIQITPQAGHGISSGYGSKPPIRLDAIDPELALIELNPGDPTSAVTILETVEMWERAIRDDRRLAPLGMARTTPTTGSALEQSIAFLTHHLPWAVADQDFDLATFADHMHRAARALGRFDPDRAAPSWGLPCPTMTDTDNCGYWIRWEPGATSVNCPRCARSWDLQWLLRIADDVWLDTDTISALTGTPRRTIQHWAAHGTVARHGLLYRLSDVVHHHQQPIGA